MLQIHFAFRSTSQPICEYILGHCGGGLVKYKDTDNYEEYKEIYPYGKQIEPGRNYFRKLLEMGKEKEQIYNFFMGNNRDKIKAVLGD
jgi:2-keto-4-pentenoate hydratase/2-oxohepta-3-ene-1,7-dioic acid hydratase in catechol pathway